MVHGHYMSCKLAIEASFGELERCEGHIEGDPPKCRLAIKSNLVI